MTGSSSVLGRRAESYRAIQNFVRGLIAEHREHPRDTLLSLLV
jgi:cytochrome P450